jgi:hypothetical protein
VPAHPAPAGHPDPDPLRIHLAANDEPCPDCGYNLRGVEDGRCPECGRRLRLVVQGASPRNGYLWFMLLAMGWVFIASGMNAARYGRLAYQEARGPTGFSSSSIQIQATPSGAVLFATPGAGAPLSFPPILPPPAAAGTPGTGGDSPMSVFDRALAEHQAIVSALNARAKQFAARSQALRARTLRSGGGTVAGGSLTLNLSAVNPTTWANLGWWGALGLAALASLILVAIIWPRRKTAAPRSLLVLACTLFVLYAGYHALMFAREIAA